MFLVPIAALLMGSYLRLDWGNPLFLFVPLTLMVLIPRRVTLRAVARAGIVATAFTAVLLVAAPIYPWVNYRLRPVGGPHAPYHEIADELTKVWRARFNTQLPIVVGGYETAAYVVFYGPDHPKMYADFDPALSPWLDYPDELKRKGWVGACAPYVPECLAKLEVLNPNAEKLTISVTRVIGGLKGATMIYEVRVSPPAQARSRGSCCTQRSSARRRDRARAVTKSYRVSWILLRGYLAAAIWMSRRSESSGPGPA
jgi:hypothetical protein